MDPLLQAAAIAAAHIRKPRRVDRLHVLSEIHRSLDLLDRSDFHTCDFTVLAYNETLRDRLWGEHEATLTQERKEGTCPFCQQ